MALSEALEDIIIKDDLQDRTDMNQVPTQKFGLHFHLLFFFRGEVIYSTPVHTGTGARSTAQISAIQDYVAYVFRPLWDFRSECQ